MSTSTILIIVIGVAVLLIIIGLISVFNELAKKRILTQEGVSGVGTCLQERNDLIPNLVETVKGYASHEKELLTKITEARSAAMSATSIDGKIVAEQQLSAALSGLRVQVEAYPDLKANQNFLQLQEELSDIENKLAAARRFFNGATTEYNNAVESFPGNLVARNFGFAKEIMFDLGTDTRKQMEEPPKIQF